MCFKLNFVRVDWKLRQDDCKLFSTTLTVLVFKEFFWVQLFLNQKLLVDNISVKIQVNFVL